MKKNILIFSVLLCFIGSSCQGPNSFSSDTIVNSDSLAQNIPHSDAPESLNATEAKTMLDGWTNSINTRNRNSLIVFYGEDVNYNGKVMDSVGVVNAIMDKLLNKGIERVQISDLTVEAPTPMVRRVEFRKKLFMKGATQENTSLILLELHGSSWKIVAENDKPLEVELKKPTPRTIAEKNITSCDEAATAIFLSSTEVKQLLADPKVQYKIEYSPGSVGNPNHRYWFWIYMPHAQDTETYARYQVDPTTGVLYEYDQVADVLKKSTSDARLNKYLNNCR